MTIGYQQAREVIIEGDFLFYRMVLHGQAPRQKQNIKVTLRNRANQFRIFTEPGRDYSIPVPSSIFYELSFFVPAIYKLDVSQL